MPGSNARDTTVAPADEAIREQLEAQLLATARTVRRAYDNSLAKLDLNMTEASLLRFVQVEGLLSQRELADRLHIGRAATGSFIEGLEDRALLNRVRDPNDARIWRIALTGLGTSLATSFDEANREILRKLRSGLDRSEQHQLGELLARVRTNAEQLSATPSLSPAPTGARARRSIRR